MLEGMAQRISDMIEREGRDVTVRSVVSTGTISRPTNTPSSDTAKVIFSGYKNHETDGAIIQANDRRAHLKWDAPITKQDKIVDGSIIYQIINLRPVAPGDENFVYIAQLRSSS